MTENSPKEGGAANGCEENRLALAPLLAASPPPPPRCVYRTVCHNERGSCFYCVVFWGNAALRRTITQVNSSQQDRRAWTTWKLFATRGHCGDRCDEAYDKTVEFLLCLGSAGSCKSSLEAKLRFVFQSLPKLAPLPPNVKRQLGGK